MELINPEVRISLETATDAGRAAHDSGVPFIDCPYAPRTLERAAWEASWRVASQETAEA